MSEASEERVYDYLDQVRELDRRIETKIWERRQIMDMATRLSAPMDGMPKGKGTPSDLVGDCAVRLAMLAKELDEAIDRYVDTKQEVVSNLERLEPEECDVLHRHYILYQTWEQVAETMSYSYTSVWRIKKRAIRHLGEILSQKAKDEIV